MNLSPKISWLSAMMMLAPFAMMEGASAPVDLGTLGGTSSQANAINQSQNIIAGSANLAGDANAHAFRRIGGGPLIDLGTLPLDPSTPTGNSVANAVTIFGVAAGTSDIDITDPVTMEVDRFSHPFYTSGTTLVDVGTLPGGDNAVGNGIELNHLVGSSYVGISGSLDAATHAFIYAIGPKKMTDLGTLPGGLNSYALGINLKLIVAGASDTGNIDPVTFNYITDAVTWTGTTITDLGNLGGSYAQANAVNDFGVAVGYAFLSGDQQADAWVGNAPLVPGSSEDIGTLGGTFAVANAINDDGVVVGSSNLAPDSMGNQAVVAFRYTKKNGMVNLNSLLPANSHWVLQSANGVSLDGTIVGVGLHYGVPHAFKWALGN